MPSFGRGGKVLLSPKHGPEGPGPQPPGLRCPCRDCDVGSDPEAV